MACPCCGGALHQIGEYVAERLDVALEGGFSSRANFNRAFLASLGQSPSSPRNHVVCRTRRWVVSHFEVMRTHVAVMAASTKTKNQ